MKASNIKNKVVWGVASIGCLGISYLLCRFAFFQMHGMKQWPNTLALVGLIIIVIASIAGKRRLSMATVAGYIGGFVLAMIFNTDGVDQGGARTNNAWKIWGCIFILSIIVGLFIDKGSRAVRFISRFIVLCGLIVLLLIQNLNQFTIATILLPVIIILGLSLTVSYVKKNLGK